jgi:hypothetical protein
LQLNKVELEKELEDTWTELLAHIYKAVNWKQIARSKSAYDIFEHRLEFARYERDIPSVIQKLCNTLSLQAPPLPLDTIEFLRDNEKQALSLMRRMPKLLTLKAAKRAKEIRELRGLKLNKEKQERGD